MNYEDNGLIISGLLLLVGYMFYIVLLVSAMYWLYEVANTIIPFDKWKAMILIAMLVVDRVATNLSQIRRNSQNVL